ncbi:MAG: hypothetical protein J6J91_06385 [Alistipes sp.]|nr:hypothetical protein [Alistipes sp.]
MKNRRNLIILLIFTIGSALFIDLNFRYWYAFMEQYMMFQTTDAYLVRHLGEVGGAAEYATEFLSMAFYYPLCAGVIISLLLALTSWAFHRFMSACGAKCSMLFALAPAFLVLCFQQESIAHIITLCVALTAAMAYTRIKPDKIRYIVGLAAIVATYQLAAPAHFVLALLIAIYEIASSRRYAVAASVIALSALLPLVAMNVLYPMPLREAFLSKHLAHPEAAFPTALIVMGLAYPAVAIVAYALRDKELIKSEQLRTRLTFGTLIAALAACILLKHDLMEQAYRYDYYAREGEWQKVTDHYHHNGVRGFEALVYVNLAASYNGTLLSDFTYTPQFGIEGLYPTDVKFYIQNIQASEVAWRIGHVNTAQRTAFIGTLGSRRSIQPRLMQRLVESYLVTGEMEVAEKFIKILESYPRLRKWATAQRPLLDPDVAAATDWIAQKRALAPTTDNMHDMQKAFPLAVEALIIDRPENKAAFDYLMAFTLAYKDLPNFLSYIRPMKGQPIDKLYQEALCVCLAVGEITEQEAVEFGVDEAVQKRFASFSQSMQRLDAESMRKMYGDTYFYYLQYVQTPQMPVNEQ